MKRNIPNVSAQLWRRLAFATVPLVAVVSFVLMRLATSLEQVDIAPCQVLVELLQLRLLLVIAFQVAPLLWAEFFINGYRRRLIQCTLNQLLRDLRMPLATWAGVCLLIGFYFWPRLSAPLVCF
ncbi:hypothetical protein NVV93_09650 [Pseudomonas sp. LS44]|uniref:hypothetical protein n=1 Tax=Pseudomonas sp. LS44 TaxID=1357074 RepID=UPI00215AF7E7|nr:hypothetical protein [Pseudomonas sp. LS44]UVE19608.1 hypothetical protein NVV93_09650 [Pseudomonas sp. LS44]